MRQHAALYNRRLSDKGVTIPAEREHGNHCYHLYVIRSKRRDELQRFLRENGVGAIVHYPVPVHLQEAYRDLGMSEGALPVTEGCAREVLSLPVAAELTEEQIETVCDLVAEFLSKHGL
jgi:dTDP-4-amino-4,6-dideoxygalactose transaminase